jgi:hypothetical protein
MGYASRAGRARTSPTNPQAHAICDRCGFRYNWVDLKWQYDWRGASLQNLKFLVCDTCYDAPQEQLRAIVVPADPTPIMNARVQDFAAAETNTRFTSGQNTVDPVTNIPIIGGDTRITQDYKDRVTQTTGEAPGGLNQLPGTDPNAVTYRTITNATNNGFGLIRLSMATTNGMITGQNVTVQEVSGVPNANGNWVITVVNSTRVDLQSSSFDGAYVSGGYVINDPSLPYGFEQVPRTGPLNGLQTYVKWTNNSGDVVLWTNNAGAVVQWTGDQ